MIDSSSPRRLTPHQWPWLVLGIALVWAALIRVPLVINAANHLDSDLAVDGLTLVEMFQGHWRWHYPGTPHVGTASLLAVAPFGVLAGPSVTTLALGGTAIALAGIAATYALAKLVFGPRVAAFSLVPLAFASTGAVWLSGRITGGHLLAVAWSAFALALLHVLMCRGGVRLALGFGLVCGLGVWNDSMFLVALGSMGVVAGLSWIFRGRSRSGLRDAGVFGIGLLIGLLPKIVGDRVDPYDAYRDTFSVGSNTEIVAGHARILALDCLPRLVAGHRIPGLQAEPGGIAIDGQALPATGGSGLLGGVTTLLGIGLLLPSLAGLCVGRRETLAIRATMLLVSGLVVAAFVMNRNIFNSDNYRYLVFLLVPWAVGLGRLLDALSRRGAGGMGAAIGLACLFGACFTLDLGAWYARLGWVDAGYRPIVTPRDEPVLAWLNEHPEATSLSGEYWDVYRLAMLTGGRVRGIPTGHYPNRFPEWSQALASGHATHVLVRRTQIGQVLRRQAVEAGGRALLQTPGGMIFDWPGPR